MIRNMNRPFCFAILGLFALTMYGVSCAHTSSQQNHGEPRPDSAFVADSLRFVWTDSLIANRGPFATPPPPELFRPDTIEGKLYWHGGVFVLPGTSDSVLLANGFINVKKKPGSVMHDYFEARWSVELDVSKLPLVIRQMRYGTQIPIPPSMPWNTFVEQIGDGVYREVCLTTIPNLPKEFFATYGILCGEEPRQRQGWADEYHCFWERERPRRTLPPEFIGMTTSEGDEPPKRTNKLPRTPSDYKFIKRADGHEYVWGKVITESKTDTATLSKLGFVIDMGDPDIYLPCEGPCKIGVFWQRNIVVDSLPSIILGINIPPLVKIDIPRVRSK